MNEKIEAILADYWDPLGTVARGGFRNEYVFYVPEIEQILDRQADVDAVAAYLLEVECQRMLLVPGQQRARHVARLLWAATHSTVRF
jgi:hypothetical protein